MSSSRDPSESTKRHETSNTHNSDESSNWSHLPRDVALMIFLKLNTFEILNSVQNVCTCWSNICNDPILWRTINMRDLGIPIILHYDVNWIFRDALFRSHSHAQLIEINVAFFVNDDLLKDIVNYAPNLRRLRLVQCFGITDGGVKKVAKQLPLLDELDLTISTLSCDAVKAIGQKCPLLKSFKYHPSGRGCECRHVPNAVAKSMPGLQHLQLFGTEMTNEQVHAILDGCPRLESLDIRMCCNVDLGGSLGKKCDQQIKDLKPPNAPYPYDDGYRFFARLDYQKIYDDFVYSYRFSSGGS